VELLTCWGNLRQNGAYLLRGYMENSFASFYDDLIDICSNSVTVYLLGRLERQIAED